MQTYTFEEKIKKLEEYLAANNFAKSEIISEVDEFFMSFKIKPLIYWKLWPLFTGVTIFLAVETYFAVSRSAASHGAPPMQTFSLVVISVSFALVALAKWMQLRKKRIELKIPDWETL